MSTTRDIGRTYDICMVMVDYKRRSDAFEVPRMNSGSLGRGRFSNGIRGPPLAETGRMDIPNFLVQGASRGGAIGGDPGVRHRPFHIVVSVLELAEVEVNPLDGPFFPAATLQAVERNRDGLWLCAPATLRTEGVGELLNHPPGAGVGDSQFAVSGGLGGKQPHLLPGLNGIFLVPASTGTPLDGASELSLDHPMSPELMFFQTANVGAGGKRSAGGTT